MLLIDSGNSAVKCRLIQQGKVENKIFPMHQHRDLAEFNLYLKSISVSKVYLASVSDEALTRQLKEAIKIYAKVKTQSIKALAELGGLKNSYDNYRLLGVDRWLTLVAAYEEHKRDSIIIDAGTAIKIEVLSANKGYLGGAILPGFRTQVERFRKLFPSINFNDPAIKDITNPGRSTLDCLYLPGFPVTIEIITEIVERWVKLLQKPYQVFITGQDAERIGKHLKLEYTLIPDMIFKGMLKQIQLQG